MLQGIDVSKWQGKIDWKEAAASGLADFAIVRARYGGVGPNSKDPRFSDNWKGALEGGVTRGAYLYLRPSQDGRAQALRMLDDMEGAGGLLAGDMSPAIDVETTEMMSPGGIEGCLASCIDTIRSATGRTPIIYTYPDFWRANMLHGSAGHGKYPLWIAHYGVRHPSVPTPWARWDLWQYTDKGAVRGIKGKVDLNLFRGDFKQLSSELCCKGVDEP